ncbi:MAG: carboxypeptidase regulatory-like domain-containing protein [Bacteroidales bacterium]|nr:carboxypeptidase regulatory-like domain-containing protein [Bacteroidales bacterium]
MKRSLIFVLTALFSMMLAASASAQSTHSVSVTLIDASNNEPVSYATVSVTPKGSSDPAKYTLTGEKGTATLSGVKDGTYVFAAEMMGYIKYEKEITVKGENVSIGDVKLELDREMLEAASVTDVGAPVTIKKDTIEYNAAAFKTTENDVLEDLLKKLPGVEVNDDGSIVVNGQTVTKVYMEGKTFFMDDPQVATKNIPAKLVEKVKVVQKKSDQAEFTGIDDGQEETVLDLSVVGGTMSGLMANITAGIGHDIPSTSTPTSANNVSSLTNYDDYRYQGNLFLGNFTNGTQIFVIGNGNNGAGGMGFGGGGMGGMMGGGGMGGGMMGGMGGFGGGGVTSSYMLGSNLGFNLFDDKMEASGNYSFNGSNTDSQSSTYSNNHLEEQGFDMITRRNSSSLSDSKGHSISMRIEHTFSPSASLIFQPQFSYRTSGSESVSTSSTQYDYFNGGLVDINNSNS